MQQRATMLAGALIAWAALTLTISPTASATVADEFWPLVMQAEHAVWGELTSIEGQGDDRLLEIRVRETVLPLGTRGPSVVRLVERAGLLPEGTPLRVGAFGLFLFLSPDDGSGASDPVDGVFLPHGFLHGDPGSVDRVAVASLLATARDVDPEERTSDALYLLGSAHVRVRRLALSWLRRNDVLLTASDEAVLRDRFLEEAAADVQERYLDFFVLRDTPLAEGAAALLLPRCTNGGLKEVTLHYLENLGTEYDKGLLLGEYPAASPEERCRLLEGYARLEMPEAFPWWEDALTSDHGGLQYTALKIFGSAKLPQGVVVFEQLLDSHSRTVRKLALQGLAADASPEAIDALQSFRARTTDEDELGRFVRSLLKNPYRHGKPAQPRKS